MEEIHEVDSSQSPKKLDGMPAIPRYTSLHELRITQNAVRTEPGRYRIFAPPPYVDNMVASQPSTSRIYPKSKGNRRPHKAIGDGEILGKHDMPDPGAFIKSAELLSSTLTKKYFPDDEEIESELNLAHTSKKTYRVVTPAYKERREEAEILVDHEGHIEGPDDEEKEILVEQGEGDHHSDYTEETVEVEIEEPDQEIAYEEPYEHSTIYGRSSMGLNPQVQLIKNLRGENNFLKEQLDCVQYKVKQLEHLLLDRNMRLRSLLAENVQLGVKVRKLTAEIGEDAAKEVLEAQPIPLPKRKVPANRR